MSSGRIENGYAAPYDFSITDVFKEGWRKTVGFKAIFWQGFLIYFLIALGLLGVTTLIEYLYASSAGETDSSLGLVRSLLALLRNLIEYPLVVGLLMLGVKRAANLPVKPSVVISYYKYFFRIIGVALLMMFLIFIPIFVGTVLIKLSDNFSMMTSGIMMIIGGLLVALGVYLIYAYLFSVIITVEKKFGVWHSLETSRRAITRHWFKLFFTSLLMFVIFLLACLPVFIGLIWALPWGYCMWGIVYRTLFGVEEAREIK